MKIVHYFQFVSAIPLILILILTEFRFDSGKNRFEMVRSIRNTRGNFFAFLKCEQT